MSSIGGVGTAVFTSVHHPGARSYPLVFSQHVVRPISILFLPLMIVTLVAALSFQPVLDYLLLGFPAAIAIAFLWTGFNLRRQIAEVRIVERSVAIRSTHEVAWHRGDEERMLPLFDARDYGNWLVIAAGDADYVIERDEWPQYDELRLQLRDVIYGM